MMATETTRIQRWEPDHGDDQIGSSIKAQICDFDDTISVLSVLSEDSASDDENSMVTERMDNKTSTCTQRNGILILKENNHNSKKSFKMCFRWLPSPIGRNNNRVHHHDETASTASSNGSYFSPQHIKETTQAWKDLNIGNGALMMD